MFEHLDTLLIDALRYRPHPSHFSLDETLAAIARFQPRRAVLTNMHTDLDYETLANTLPPNVVPAYDGMQVDLVRSAEGREGRAGFRYALQRIMRHCLIVP